HTKAWEKYWKKGVQYYKEWQDKTGDDVVLPCDFEDNFSFRPPNLCLPHEDIRDILVKEGLSIEREYYAFSAQSPKEKSIADFTNTVSGTAGVFLATGNSRGKKSKEIQDQTYDAKFPEGRDPVPFQFSAVAWWMWKKSLLTVHPDWVQDEKKADYSGIKAFFRRDIDNYETLEILNEVLNDRDTGEVLEWTPNDPGEDDAFWPLLGSPNGNGVQHFATDYKVALKGKGISMIRATKIDIGFGNQYQMWMLFK
ncbi:MAG: hypothetical protein Q9180_006570, partial [Flavoplaca navasiana]